MVELSRLALTDSALASSMRLISAINKEEKSISPLIHTRDPSSNLVCTPSGHTQIRKLKCITFTLLNEKLSDPQLSICDVTIMIVYKLCCGEMFRGNWKEAKVHRDGLLKILKLRGGIVKIDPMLDLSILMCEALDPFERPTFQRPLVLDHIAARRLHDVCHELDIQLPKAKDLPEKLTLPMVNGEFLILIHHLRDMFLYAENFDIKPQSDSKLGQLARIYQIKAIVIEHQLACHDPQDQVEALLKASILAFINITYFTVNTGNPTIRAQVRQLQASLNDEVAAYLFRSAPDLLLWVVMIGTYCSLHQVEYRHFLGLVGMYSKQLEVICWEEFQKRLYRILFWKGRLAGEFSKLFHDATVPP